ncbi:hypothetical protein C9374_000880 [Naegleria lovaniensis]|uniref:Mitochondrial import inner membrane translocase subunit TIM22 n=1 Tax=Naegleria lovaniensis TaxID=51637 RepID=A0AA88KLM6_NAELO|nr:uncharacterized protein C9374_000880 [Naegleria lovaniensis]KAG2388030.1 hypothetical protein C9374_000880 [Naegleria lovaniensis]
MNNPQDASNSSFSVDDSVIHTPPNNSSIYSPPPMSTFNPHDIYSKQQPPLQEPTSSYIPTNNLNALPFHHSNVPSSSIHQTPSQPPQRIIRPPPMSLFLEGADAAEQIQKQLAIKKAMETMTESCLSKSAFAAVAGTVLGGAFGIISTSFTLESTLMKTPQQIIREEQMTSREKIREYFRETKTRSVSMAKSFGAVGALYSLFECSLEKVRAKKDVKGSLMAGCLSGAVLARKAGIGAMIFGCLSFSAFSGAIDYFTEYS